MQITTAEQHSVGYRAKYYYVKHEIHHKCVIHVLILKDASSTVNLNNVSQAKKIWSTYDSRRVISTLHDLSIKLIMCVCRD